MGTTRRRGWTGSLAIVLLLQLVTGVSLVSDQAEAAYQGQFLWPMDGTVTSLYWECRSGCDRYHRAIDIANGCDTPIYAARAGTADTRSDPDGYGNYVVVDHDDGYETVYAHMESFAVEDGDEVDTDTVLGYEGSTGSSTGCHVHFEVRQQGNGESYEKKQFLPGQLDDSITQGTEVPYEMQVLELDSTTDVLDGPDISDVPGQGDQVLTTEEAGDRFAAYSAWTNDEGETWYPAYVNGRIGWLPATAVSEVGATTERVQVDTALNVRAGPGTGYTDIGNVYGAQEYVRLASEVDGDGDTWYELHYEGTDDGETGWVHGGWTTPITYEDPGEGEEDLSGYTITVDPGHGGEDPGGQGFGVDEKEVVLDIGLGLRDLLEADGATVLMTRTTDETVSLQERVDLANDNDADRFISVHANACGGCGAQGTETYYHDSLGSGSQAADLAAHTQDHVVAEVGTEDRGVKQADFFVLRETEMPAILVETAFIDQADDHDLLTDPATQRTFAEAILFGLQEHLGITPHLPEEQNDTTPPTVDIETPGDGTSQPGPVHVEATASDAGSGVEEVAFLVDGQVRHADTTSPYTWDWPASQDPGDHTVTARATDGAGNQATHDHAVTVEAGLSDGFEEALAGWTTNDPDGPATWQRTDARAATGTWSLAVRDYGADEADTATTSEIDLTGTTTATLELESWMEGERACSLFGCTIYDAGRIEVTSDGGQSWRTLASQYWDSGGQWETLTYDLDQEAGSTVQVRFTFESDGSVHNEGWYIDDVQVTTGDDGDPEPEPTGGLDEDFESGDPGWTIDDQGGSAIWQLTEARSSSPIHSMAIADYGPDESDHLVTEAVDLTGMSSPTLTVESWMEGEESCSLFFGCTIYDFGRLQVKATTEGSWTTLLTDYTDSGGWETLSYDLGDWSDQTVEVRFSFFSDGSVQNEGWYLDDVVIS